ncbi:FAD-dependent oxidoreductase [Agrococcus sp. SCSIO52902]|uniref:NAD(P)/FAD-dependent oxidoreductase n=1 Tax=Agrococcus sp. SCSIO52902 TaxID=2933290 RepID=UPI001FF345FF|nr:FAD-dependent oxidoreductase [Agrococcus sp. SCSIO52902]UOW01953.1 FAD-binding oxidoreductase [Agrococcus sp. SCSIO52902]
MRVLVIGAGVIGAACALRLSQAGAEVLLVDRSGVAAETSSRCEGNVLVSDKSADASLRAEAELAIASNAMWRELAAQLDAERGDGPATEFEAKGGIVVAFPGNAEALERFADGQRSIGIRAHAVDRAALADLEPDLAPEVALGVHYPDDAQVQPSLATQSMAAAALRRGARLVRAEVTGARLQGERIVGVETTAGPIDADAVVVCAGPWSGEVSARLGGAIDIRPRRGTILVTTPMPQRIRHKVYDADYVGAVGSGAAELQTSTVVESTPAGTVLIGSSRERVGFDETGTLPALAEIAAKATRLFPFLADVQLLRTYSGFRPYARDHLPVIGPDLRVAGLFHAAGHEGAGIGLAPATAALIAHHVLGAAAPLDAAPFLPSRPSLMGAAA